MNEITDLHDAHVFVRSFLNAGRGDIVALTGAGISTSSGIPDFRSPGGIWSQMEPIQYQDFVASEACRLEDWRRRFEMQSYFRKAEPNAAHLALAHLADLGLLDMLITQNVDGLHQASGIDDNALIELHGNSTYATCLSCGMRAELDDQRPSWEAGHAPVCDSCGGFLKAAVVSFGQMMPENELQRAALAAQNAALFVVIGSSLVVHPAAQLPVLAVQAGAELVIINRESTPLDQVAHTIIRCPIAETFAGFGAMQG
ncbi:NAD-dependent deacetylase [Roseibium hamelinense]|uniref:protein acetyllysine N-acetyltransferase n=1 Tax=Roseibium hamelinense TaxID=150831 RepID=A0A562TH91_9HYPH|nr:Sir2 family NAD-dependent protein deacetylase [Roseibium hamelinense]MTI46094.1 NAD-dependent deacetylase [Roseibium hamelinense]TWI92713.1 NAD-dependent deacetylase [Roseibium hamelinense]